MSPKFCPQTRGKMCDAVDQPDPPGASEYLRRATELFDRRVAYVDAAR